MRTKILDQDCPDLALLFWVSVFQLWAERGLVRSWRLYTLEPNFPQPPPWSFESLALLCVCPLILGFCQDFEMIQSSYLEQSWCSINNAWFIFVMCLICRNAYSLCWHVLISMEEGAQEHERISGKEETLRPQKCTRSINVKTLVRSIGWGSG